MNYCFIFILESRILNYNIMKLKIISTLIVSFLIVTVKASTLLPIFTILPTPVCQVSVTQTASGWA